MLSILGVAITALAVPSVAGAHGGKRIVTRVEGGYGVALDALAVRSGQAVAVVDYTVYLTDRRTGAPVDDARVQVRVDTPERRIGPLQAHRRGDTYEVLIPVADDEWPRYRLHVNVQGPLGTVAFAYTPPGVRYEWLGGNHSCSRAQPLRRSCTCAPGSACAAGDGTIAHRSAA